MPALVDLTGETFHSWRVLGRAASRSGSTFWRCRCSCGETKDVNARSLVHGKSKTCGHSREKRIGHLGASFYCRLKSGARRRNLSVEVSLGQMSDLLEAQGFRCALSGIPIWAARSEAEYRSQTASLDRIDSKLGYVAGNLQWVHKDVNQMKMDLDQDYFILICKFIAERGV